MRKCLAALCLLLAALPAVAQSRLMPLGDSITQGGQGFASYRYELWFDLADAGFAVDFVGQRDFLNDGDPDPLLYPDYLGSFDRDHEGWWGRRTDEIADLVLAAGDAAARRDARARLRVRADGRDRPLPSRPALRLLDLGQLPDRAARRRHGDRERQRQHRPADRRVPRRDRHGGDARALAPRGLARPGGRRAGTPWSYRALFRCADR